MAAHVLCQNKNYRITEEVSWWHNQSKSKVLILHMMQVNYRISQVQSSYMIPKDARKKL